MRSLRQGPLADAHKKLEANRKGIIPQGLTINHSGPRAQTPQQRSYLDVSVRLPGFAGNDARTPGAYVFRDSLLGDGVNVQAGQINCHVHRGTTFKSARLAIHGAPRCFLSRVMGMSVGEGSTARKSYALNPGRGQEVSFLLHPQIQLSGLATSVSQERTSCFLAVKNQTHKLCVF